MYWYGESGVLWLHVVLNPLPDGLLQGLANDVTDQLELSHDDRTTLQTWLECHDSSDGFLERMPRECIRVSQIGGFGRCEIRVIVDQHDFSEQSSQHQGVSGGRADMPGAYDDNAAICTCRVGHNTDLSVLGMASRGPSRASTSSTSCSTRPSRSASSLS